MPGNIKKILILKWGAFGDIVASTPAINLIIKAFPAARIDILSNTLFTELFPQGESFYKNYYDIRSGKFGLIRKIRQQKYDLVINLKWTSEGAAWITRLSGASYRAGSGPQKMRFVYTLKSDYIIGKCHEIVRNLEIVKGIGIEGEKIEFINYIDKISEQKITEFFTGNGLNGNFVLGVHPGASKKSKSWDTLRFRTALIEIRKLFDIKIILFYGKNDKKSAEDIISDIRDSNIMLGPETKNIRELSAAINKCNLFFCNNSGPMNLAVSLGVPTVAILGSTHPEDWGPYGEKHTAIKSPLYLSSYNEDDEFTAMKAIRIEKVISILSNRISELIKN